MIVDLPAKSRKQRDQLRAKLVELQVGGLAELAASQAELAQALARMSQRMTQIEKAFDAARLLKDRWIDGVMTGLEKYHVQDVDVIGGVGEVYNLAEESLGFSAELADDEIIGPIKETLSEFGGLKDFFDELTYLIQALDGVGDTVDIPDPDEDD